MKNVGNNSRGRSQGVPKVFMAPMYRAHCAVIFAIAQLSCHYKPMLTRLVRPAAYRKQRWIRWNRKNVYSLNIGGLAISGSCDQIRVKIRKMSRFADSEQYQYIKYTCGIEFAYMNVSHCNRCKLKKTWSSWMACRCTSQVCYNVPRVLKNCF